MKIIRHFRKSLSLRIVNFAGLSIVFACLLLSAGYIKREMSYDRHHANADRIVRLSLQFDDQPVDGRLYGNALNAVLQQMPEIERTVKMRRVNTAVLTYQGKQRVANDFYMVNRDFLQVFDIPLAGLTVLLVSVVSVSLQSWRAANQNPVETINRP